MSDLRKLIGKAERDIEKYKHPNLDEVQSRISEILVAAGMGRIACDEITSIGISGEGDKSTVYLSTKYYAKSCECSNDYSFPASILDSDNPVFSAKKWGMEKEINRLKASIAEAERVAKYYQGKLGEKEKVLQDFLEENRPVVNSCP